MTSQAQLDHVFGALADATRRAILAKLAQEEATVNELVAPFDLKQPTISKHLKVLERAGLVSRGREAQFRIVPVPDWVRSELDDWLAAAAIDRGRLFRRVNKVGRAWGDGMTVKAV